MYEQKGSSVPRVEGSNFYMMFGRPIGRDFALMDSKPVVIYKTVDSDLNLPKRIIGKGYWSPLNERDFATDGF